ncbi:MAG: hypothetical protein COA97_03295 [Flavobacteriales bacterium]|nr:MAG: hypothetical protein COA97_03295 [Flavobacteriales bacterium]
MEKTNKYLVLLVIITGLTGLHFLFGDSVYLKPNILLYVALSIGVTSIISSYLAEKIVWVWDKIALVLGTVNSKILLSAIFYLFLVPIALISRVFKKEDELILKKRTEGSYYKERNHEYSSEDLENVF